MTAFKRQKAKFKTKDLVSKVGLQSSHITILFLMSRSHSSEHRFTFNPFPTMYKSLSQGIFHCDTYSAGDKLLF